MIENIRSIIVDDDPNDSERLNRLLNQTGFVIEVLAVCRNVDEGLKAIAKFSPELVFLDVQLQRNETGYDLLKAIDNINFNVIFTTSHKEEAINAIKVNALDFLLKTIILDDLIIALKKFVMRRNEIIAIEQLRSLQNYIKSNNAEVKEIWIFDINHYTKIQVANILYGESDNEIVWFFLETPVDGKLKIQSSDSIGEWEKKLSISKICRIHNKYLINIDKILKRSRNCNSVIMLNNKQLDVSKSKRENLISRLKAS